VGVHKGVLKQRACHRRCCALMLVRRMDHFGVVQKLSAAITDLDKLRCSEHTLYLWCHHQPTHQVRESPAAVRSRPTVHPLAPLLCIGRARGVKAQACRLQTTTALARVCGEATRA
jgi:hypothetical protein